MKVQFAGRGWEDYLTWQRDRQMLKRVNALIEDIRRNGRQGIGKPEQLRGNWAGFWSRRIDQEHRPGAAECLRPATRRTTTPRPIQHYAAVVSCANSRSAGVAPLPEVEQHSTSCHDVAPSRAGATSCPTDQTQAKHGIYAVLPAPRGCGQAACSPVADWVVSLRCASSRRRHHRRCFG